MKNRPYLWAIAIASSLVCILPFVKTNKSRQSAPATPESIQIVTSDKVWKAAYNSYLQVDERHMPFYAIMSQKEVFRDKVLLQADQAKNGLPFFGDNKKQHPFRLYKSHITGDLRTLERSVRKLDGKNKPDYIPLINGCRSWINKLERLNEKVVLSEEYRQENLAAETSSFPASIFKFGLSGITKFI